MLKSTYAPCRKLLTHLFVLFCIMVQKPRAYSPSNSRPKKKYFFYSLILKPLLSPKMRVIIFPITFTYYRSVPDTWSIRPE